MKKNIPVITVDGPGGTGKGTLSQLLAQKLEWHLLDSGVLYRALAMAAGKHGVDLDDESSLEVLAAHLDVIFQATENRQARARILLESEDVSEIIRTDPWAQRASQVAALASVRTALLERQRTFCQSPGLIADGRDMGTVVFPQAPLKFYLDASIPARAKRRHLQLKDKGIHVSLDRITAELVERDQRDKGRCVAPLKPAEDAIVIDTTDLSIDQVLTLLINHVNDCSASLDSGAVLS